MRTKYLQTFCYLGMAVGLQPLISVGLLQPLIGLILYFVLFFTILETLVDMGINPLPETLRTARGESKATLGVFYGAIGAYLGMLTGLGVWAWWVGGLVLLTFLLLGRLVRALYPEAKNAV